jgi:pimeloyl-ACP methyl ester carboxylesterase
LAETRFRGIGAVQPFLPLLRGMVALFAIEGILQAVTNPAAFANIGRSSRRDARLRSRPSKGRIMSDKINHGRRRFFGTAAMTIAVAQLGTTVSADARPRNAGKVVQNTAKSNPAEINATVVLVHGAWADGSSWAHVITPLLSRRMKAMAAPIPLTSLSDDVAALERALERTEGPVVLVAHAYAGAVIGACTNERVKSLVFISALAPDEGETVAEVFYRDKPSPEAPKLAPDSHGLLWMPNDKFITAWCQHARPEQAALLAAIQRPIAVAAIQEKAPKPAWKTKPSWYLLAEQDRMINPATQQFMAQRMGARIRSEKVDHASPLTAPQLVVATILEAVTSSADHPDSAQQHG